jgi:hypothetical protein
VNTLGENLANKLFAIDTFLQSLKRVTADSDAQQIIADMQVSINEAKVLIVDLLNVESSQELQARADADRSNII